MWMNEKERRRPLFASAAITIALLLPTIRVVTGPSSLGSLVRVAEASGEGAQTPAATNKAPTVAGKTGPAWDSFSSRSCNQPQPAKSNALAAPAESTALYHRDETKRLQCI